MNFFKCETTVIFDEKHGYYKTVPKIALDYGEILRDFTYDTDPFSDYGIVILYKGVDWETISEGILDLYFKQYLDPVHYSDKEIEVIKKLYHMEPYKRKQLYETCEDLNEMATVELEKIIKPRYTSEKLDDGGKRKMTNKPNMIEPIPIEEAIHDYTQAYKDYKKLIQQANKYIQSDKDVLKAILKHYLPDCNIKIIGEQIILTYTGEDRFDFLKKVFEQTELTDCKTTWGLENNTTTVYIDIKGGLNKQ